MKLLVREDDPLRGSWVRIVRADLSEFEMNAITCEEREQHMGTCARAQTQKPTFTSTNNNKFSILPQSMKMIN